MPKRTDIRKVLLIGSGPIVIGQACEFDYSGTQACRVLKEEGYEVVLANSNPATIMTDPDFANATYIEPLSAPVLTEIIKQENPDALLPTLGGQTALNLAMELEELGVLKQYGVELIGADATAIATAVSEQSGTIEEVYEPYLIQEGYLMRTTRGRTATDKSFKHLGRLKSPDQDTLF